MSDSVAASTLEAGRDAYARHGWSEAFELLSSADAEQELTAADLNVLAYSAYWTGRLELYLQTLKRAYRLLLAYRETGQAAFTAEQFVVSPHAVHRHLANIRNKLGQPTRAATVAHAAKLGLL